MEITDILDVERVSLDDPASSKKRTLEVIAKLAAGADTRHGAKELFECLLARERLGSTGLGEGVALPHARVPGMSEPVAALLRLATPVDFDAPDGVVVDLVFGLLVPEESTEEHLQILAAVAAAFAQDSVRRALRASTNGAEALRVIAGAAGPPG